MTNEELSRQVAVLAGRLAELESRPDLEGPLHELAGRVTQLENALPDDHIGAAPGKLNGNGEVVP